MTIPTKIWQNKTYQMLRYIKNVATANISEQQHGDAINMALLYESYANSIGLTTTNKQVETEGGFTHVTLTFHGTPSDLDSNWEKIDVQKTPETPTTWKDRLKAWAIDPNATIGSTVLGAVAKTKIDKKDRTPTQKTINAADKQAGESIKKFFGSFGMDDR